MATGTSTISATLGGVTGSTVLTVTAAALQSIAVTPANPSVAKGQTAAVHRHRHLLRQLDAGPDQPGDLGLGHTRGGHHHRRRPGHRRGDGHLHRSAPRSAAITGSTVLTVTAAALQSIAVTPANPSVAKGPTEQFTATGTYSDSSTQDLTSQVTWASATPAVATITAAGLATGVATGTSTISATLGGVTGSTVLTVTAAALQSIAVTPANPSVAKGQTAAVHRHRHLLRQLDAGPDQPGDLGLGDHRPWPPSPPPGLATGVATGTSTISATLGGVTGSTVLTVTAAALQSIAVTPANPSIAKGTTSSSPPPAPSPTTRRRT